MSGDERAPCGCPCYGCRTTCEAPPPEPEPEPDPAELELERRLDDRLP